MAGRIYVGTSGWVYDAWRVHLYRDVPKRRWLEHASRTFATLEINGSFYTQIKPETYARWRAETPPGFRFSLKGHRYITHYKRLRDADESIARIRDQAAALGDKLANVVWQLPAHLALEEATLDAFLSSLRRRWRTPRHAIEARHPSWFTDEVADRLRNAGVAVAISDAPDFPMWNAVTADFVYVRLHGHSRKYASSYAKKSLVRWAAEAKRWSRQGRDVYVYFDNDAEGAAVKNAISLRALLDSGG
jgi:uncharacterized protein YecE (DUF72 family)